MPWEPAAHSTGCGWPHRIWDYADRRRVPPPLNHYLERDTDATDAANGVAAFALGPNGPSRSPVGWRRLIVCGTLYLALATNALATLLGILTSVTYLCAVYPAQAQDDPGDPGGGVSGAVPPLSAGPRLAERLPWMRGSCSPSCSCGNSRISTPSPGCTGKITAARESTCFPVVDRDGKRTFREILLTAALLVPVSLLPAVTGLAGARYFFGALVLGIMLVEVCLWAAASKSNVRAKWLMHATVLHLPLLLGLLIYDKFTR